MNFTSAEFHFKSSDPCRVIGEIGVNHNNNGELLFKLVDAAIDVGVDIVKLQRFSAKAEISTYAPKAEYQKRVDVGDSQLEMATKLELSDELIYKVFEYCKRKKVAFLCAAFDHESVDFIADKLECKSIKVPSPEITNRPLLEYMANKFDGILLSSGASSLLDCVKAIDWIQYKSSSELVLMHCLSEYPAPLEEINLNAMKTMADATKLPVGYSDHTEGVIASIVAATLGAVVLEKHFTMDKTLPGPDHKASANIQELALIVETLKKVHLMKGDGVKRVAPSELKNRFVIRKSLVSSKNIEPGTIIDRALIGIKRPYVEGSVAPEDITKILGLKINHAKKYDEPILWTDFHQQES